MINREYKLTLANGGIEMKTISFHKEINFDEIIVIINDIHYARIQYKDNQSDIIIYDLYNNILCDSEKYIEFLVSRNYNIKKLFLALNKKDAFLNNDIDFNKTFFLSAIALLKRKELDLKYLGYILLKSIDPDEYKLELKCTENILKQYWWYKIKLLMWKII